MENQDLTTATRLREYIAFMLPWTHGHQLKAIGDYVAAIIEHQTACQAQLARYFGNQEAAVKRPSENEAVTSGKVAGTASLAIGSTASQPDVYDALQVRDRTYVAQCPGEHRYSGQNACEPRRVVAPSQTS